MMSKNLICLFCILFIASSLKAQVIYERTYPDAFPSLKDGIQLSDLSTVSFANNSPCYFTGWRHIGPTGSIIKEGGLANESTHSLKYKQIADDSVLVSCRVGPLDFDRTNYFQVSLWTPDSLYTLVLDTVFKNYWEDCEWCDTPIHYDAFLVYNHHVLYQRGDTVYSKNLITGNVDYKESFTYIYNIYPVKNGIMMFSEGNPPSYFNSMIEQINTLPSLDNNPFDGDIVPLDSFLVGRKFGIPTSLHAVNAFNENSREIDLSTYFSKIEGLVARGDILLVTGINGISNYVLQLDKNFEVIGENVYVVPDTVYAWEFCFYPERLYAWRTDGLSEYEADYRIAYSFFDPQPITYLDLTMVDISVDSVFYWPPSHHLPAHLFLSASVINHSEDTLHNLTIHFEEDPIQCDPGIYPKHVSNLETAPGDTAYVKFSVISWETAMNEPFMQTFFVQHGNHHLDSNKTDNVFEFVYLVSNTEEAVSVEALVYPNPFTDFIAVSKHTDVIRLNLYDQTGRRVSNGYDQLTDLGALPAGIYFLQIQTGNSIATTRVVKVE